MSYTLHDIHQMPSRFTLILSITFFSFFFLQTIPTASSAALNDIDGNKNEVAITWLYNNHIVSGYTDGTFRPTATLNRAELAAILAKGATINPSVSGYNNCFSDVHEEWFAPYICFFKDQQWVKGYADKSFRPDQKVTKEEALKMLEKSQGFSVPQSFTETPQLFDDVSSGQWYYPFIYIAKNKEILEQTNGHYGVGEFITRGEISENIYRSIIIKQKGLTKFSEYQHTNPLPSPAPPSVPLQATCQTPLQIFQAIEIKKDAMKIITPKVCSGYRYTACTQNPTGDPDLYAGGDKPTTSHFEQKSTNRIAKPDCITFEPNGSTYFLGIFGAADSQTDLWISASKLGYVPAGFEKSLSWFANGCSTLTTSSYGGFNTPWGNNQEPPFFENYTNYLHGGTDYACPVNTVVKAMCDGEIVDSNSAGNNWGWHTVLECKSNGHTLSLAFIHLQPESVLPIGTTVKAGDPIGKVFDLKVAGEIAHVHITACQSSHDTCEAAGFKPERGAAKQTEWPSASKLWFDIDWKTNQGLYKLLPTAPAQNFNQPKG